MNLLRRSIRKLGGRDATFEAQPALESVYRHLFIRELGQMGEEDRFYPVGGAANYSLLYLICRIGIELQPDSVLDIGAGQSTLLWNLLAARGHAGRVTTLEHDADWAGRIGASVDHRILVTPLRPVHVGAAQTHSYDWDAVRAAGPFSVIVCDGPIGSPRFSRCGVLALIDETLPHDFAILMDDCERPGEQDTVTMIHDRLRSLGRDYQVGVTRAAKTQVVFAGGRYVGICHA